MLNNTNLQLLGVGPMLEEPAGSNNCHWPVDVGITAL